MPLSPEGQKSKMQLRELKKPSLKSVSDPADLRTYLCFLFNNDFFCCRNWVWFQGSLYGGTYELCVAFDDIIQIPLLRLCVVIHCYLIGGNQVILNARMENM